MKQISVIVPVYNVKEYLTECIESILMQRNCKIQLILIDDGSTDGSAVICDKYAEENEQILALHQKNAGVCAARNTGMSVATGEYIVFVDADDYLKEKNVFQKLVQALEGTEADIAVGNYMRLWKGRMLKAESHNSFSKEERQSGSFRFSGFFSVGVLSYVWGKMYRRSFLEKYQMHFGEYTYAEDKSFNFFCYVYGAKYTFIEEYGYVYRKNDASISGTYREDSTKCWMKIAQDLQMFLEEQKLEREYGDLVANTIFFAAFFDGKMAYLQEKHSLSGVRHVLKGYGRYPLSRKYFIRMATGKGLKEIPSVLWKIMLWGFSVAMYCHCYTLLALGIKLLIDWRMDERLSDTGLRD